MKNLEIETRTWTRVDHIHEKHEFCKSSKQTQSARSELLTSRPKVGATVLYASRTLRWLAKESLIPQTLVSREEREPMRRRRITSVVPNSARNCTRVEILPFSCLPETGDSAQIQHLCCSDVPLG